MSEYRDFVNDYFGSPIGGEFFDLVCGSVVGVPGYSRIVFDYLPDKSCVIKFERTSRRFQNVMEWDLWQQHKRAHTSVCDFLAPCVSISHSGSCLIQKKTKPVPFDFKLPKMIPAILNNDAKWSNWGLYRGKLVCHDYGRHDAIREASIGKNMAKADWLDSGNGHFKPLAGQHPDAI